MEILHMFLYFLVVIAVVGVSATGGKLAFYLYRTEKPWTALAPFCLLVPTCVGALRCADHHWYAVSAILVIIYLMVFYGVTSDEGAD